MIEQRTAGCASARRWSSPTRARCSRPGVAPCLLAQRSAAALLLDLAGVSRGRFVGRQRLFLAWLRKAGERACSCASANPPASLISLAALYGVSELLPLA
jgi:ABC-type transporter Mla MlaB component